MDMKQEVNNLFLVLSLLVVSSFCLFACLLKETDELWHAAQLPESSCRATDIFDETHTERVMTGSERSNEGHCCTAAASVAPSKVRQEGFRKETKVLSHASLLLSLLPPVERLHIVKVGRGARGPGRKAGSPWVWVSRVFSPPLCSLQDDVVAIVCVIWREREAAML